jgi:hypothetical protein
MKYYSNVVSFLPDSDNYTLDVTNSAGWYVLYPPREVASSTSPSLIYFDPLLPNYLGWTTTVPLNCVGNTNYATGRCELIYQRLEDERRLQKDINRGVSALPVGKDVIPVLGRMMDKKLNFAIPETEIFCLFSGYESCTPLKPRPFLPPDFTTWSVGMITYAKSVGTVLVSGAVFGQYIKGIIRDLGRFESFKGSLTPHTVTEEAVELPSVGTGIDLVTSTFTYVGQVLNFSNLTAPTEVEIVFAEQIFGNIPDSPGRYLTIDNNKVNIKGSESSFSVDISGLVFLNTVTDFTLYIGNQKQTLPF